MGDLNKRRGVILANEAEGDDAVLGAQVPLSEMFGYSTALRSMTQVPPPPPLFTLGAPTPPVWALRVEVGGPYSWRVCPDRPGCCCERLLLSARQGHQGLPNCFPQCSRLISHHALQASNGSFVPQFYASYALYGSELALLLLN